MKIEKFEDLTFWKEAQDLVSDISGIFEKVKDAAFKNELYKPLLGISSNIASGFERKWNNEFKQLLYIAKGCNWEFRSLICIWKSLDYISSEDFDKLYERSSNISRMIWGFLKSIK
ncbi:MAG: S23 ribosomal protein [uncultured bacterium (gcode 4)]|uniref:S23 ribosomal protein n=1 Tax=uncultured bacterium (gcode 4) TaxID=1234023 RepID=K2H0P2_9BACT|nr:MAG: S23 ribosomal protein [uncultured bacterium (gcode 4)]